LKRIEISFNFISLSVVFLKLCFGLLGKVRSYASIIIYTALKVYTITFRLKLCHFFSNYLFA